MSTILEQIQSSLAQQQGRPPLDTWQPALSGDIDILIDEQGRWFHQGDLMTREALVRLFASILRREADGDYYLVTPVEKWRIQVRDAPLLVVDVDVIGKGSRQQQLVFVSNVGSRSLLTRSRPLWVEFDQATMEPKPYAMFDYALAAKLKRSVFYHLVDLAEERDGSLWLRSDDTDFELGAY